MFSLTKWICVLSVFTIILAGVNAFLEEPEIDFGKVYPSNQEAESKADFWRRKAQDILQEHLQNTRNVNHKQAKNVILFLGDGMSLPTVTASRIYKGQRLMNVSGEEYHLFFEKFPYTGLSKTYCVNKQVADSACTATAYLCGVKGNFETIGVTAAVKKNYCIDAENTTNHVDSIAQWAIEAGKSAGIVTTVRVTHASPSANYAHVSHRDHESDADVRKIYKEKTGNTTVQCRDIATQLVRSSPGKDLNVILGGGRSKLTPNTESGGDREDNVNLINAWEDMHRSKGRKVQYLKTADELRNLDYNNTDYLMGLFADEHLDYNMFGNKQLEPTLKEMTEAAINVLKKNENGFFLFVEGGKIDYGHHANQPRQALDETVELDKAIEKAFEMTSPEDTLIVVTADHAHVMTVAGYSKRGNDILGLNSILGADRKPYATLSYANGPGYIKPENNTRHNLTNEELTAEDAAKYPSMVPLDDETHGGDDVGVFATGPWSDLFTGVYEQNAIPHMMAYAACIGTGEKSCNSSQSTR